MTGPQISDEELTSLMVAMKNRYGLDFTNYEKTSLKRGITRLMGKHKMDSMFELWGTILKDKEFFMAAIDELLVNLTELFRNPDVWLMVRDKVLNEIKSRPIKIWHAGCSTGEEVYTMAIVLEEKGLLLQNRTLATDLSNKALSKAIQGDYSHMVLKQYLKPFLEFYPNRSLEDYFEFKSNHATIKKHYQHHITFKIENLVHQAPEPGYDLIFCRNVMIYFDEKLKTRVLDLFHQSLKPKGFLIIGYYDIMPEYGKELFEVYDLKTRVYRKK